MKKQRKLVRSPKIKTIPSFKKDTLKKSGVQKDRSMRAGGGRQDHNL